MPRRAPPIPLPPLPRATNTIGAINPIWDSTLSPQANPYVFNRLQMQMTPPWVFNEVGAVPVPTMPNSLRPLPRQAEPLPPPIRAYHGSPNTDLVSISANPTIRQYDNATSRLGAFTSPNVTGARRYAGESGAVYRTSVPLRRPYEMSWKEFDYFQSPNRDRNGRPASDWAARANELNNEAEALRARLVNDGYDGIIVRGGRNNSIIEIASFADLKVEGREQKRGGLFALGSKPRP